MARNQSREINTVSAFLKRPLQSAVMALWPLAAAADMPDVQVSSTFSLDHGVQMTWNAGSLETEFATAPSVLTTAKATTPLPNNAQLTYSGDLLVTGNGLATTNGATEIQGGISLNYRQKFGADNAWQYQLRGEVDHLLSDSETVFLRERLGAHIQYRLNAEHSTAGSVRVGYRDQNDTRLAGYDQTEFLGQLTHTWRPNKDRLAFSGTIFTETRRADLQRYSYDEVGVRVMARVPVSDVYEITARASYYEREFLDSYSTTDPTRRDDTRIKLSVEVERDFSELLSGSVYAGWDENKSTIAETAFDGATIGLAITYKWP